MGYTLTQINTVLSKADRAIHILGSVAYNKKFAELDETYWYDRDIIFLYKSAVEWGKVNDRVGTERMDWIVERLEAMMEIYDYGSLTPIYSQVAQVTGINTVNFLTEETDPTVPAWVKAITQLDIDSWDDSYGNKITSAAVTGTSTKTLTLNQQDGGTVTASWTDINTDAVSSVFGRTGAVVAQSGDYTTTQVTEGLNLYYTDGRVRSAISESIVGIDYNSTTGVFSTTAGYSIPTTSSQANWDTAYANRITSLTTTGTSGAATLISNVLNIPIYTLAGLGGISLTSLSASSPLIYDNTTGAFSIQVANGSQNGYLSSSDWTTFNSKQSALTFSSPLVNTAGTVSIPAATSSVNGYLTSTDWTTFNAKQGAITLTTTGSSGAATLIGTTLNIPNYSGALTGYVPYTGATANVDLGEFELKAGQFTLDISPTGTAAVGTTRWNNTTGTSETTLKGGTVILKNGVDLVARVVNKVTPNATLTKAAYQAVRVSGAQGQRLAVSYAQADGDPNSADTIGLVTETIATNQEGFIMTVGQLEGINTTGSLQGETWTDGDVLYLSPTIPGAITNIKPSAPQHLVVMGYVEYAHANNGKIYVKIMNGWELGELHDVNTTGAVNGSVLKYNGTIWVPSSDTGITSLNGLTALSQSFATGTSGTDFNIASATATHTFNLPTASATNRGALSSADWTRFNNNIPAGTPSVGDYVFYNGSNLAYRGLIANAPLSYNSSTATFSISQATTSTDGYLSSTDWNTFNNKQAAGNYITALTGEATASGPGSATVTLSTSAVTGKLLTGLNLTGGGSIAATDSILQAFGKVQNQISGLAGGVTYQGTWNASTNTPTLTSSVGTKGYYYIVDVAGSTNLNGITDWKIGDWAIFNGSTWDKVDNTDAVSSVNGFTGAVSLTTSNIAEGTNLYYLDSRARLALSFTAGSGAYDNTTGVITIPTNTNQLTNGANFISLSSLSASSPLSYNSGTGAFSIQVANGSQNGYLSSTDWNTFNGKQAALNGTGFVKISGTTISYDNSTYYLASNPNSYIALTALSAGAGISYNNTTGVIASTITQYTDALARAAISLTTTGTSGAATYNSTTGVLNVPQYAPDLSGYVPTSRTLTINGTAYDLSANRSWSVGTVTSVGLSSATSGVTIGSSPITTSGTITLAIATASGSQQGLLSSTDWTTFNNKQSALTNPVTGTGTTNYLPKFTGTSTIGDSSISDVASSPLSIVKNASSITSNLIFISPTTGTNASILNLDNAGAGSFYIGRQNSAGNSVLLNGLGAYASVIGHTGSQTLHLVTNAISRVQVDGSGNLGLGVTPSAWNLSGMSTMQIKNASISGYNNNSYLGANWSFISGDKYIATGAATIFVQDSGTFQWLQAPSGTAGNAISFTQAMTLNASGNLSIGNTNDTYKLDVSGTGRFTGTISGGGNFELVNAGGPYVLVGEGTGVNQYAAIDWDATNNRLRIATQPYAFGANGGQITLTTNGNVGIGTTSPGVSLDIVGSGIRVINSTSPLLYLNNTTVQWKTYLPSGSNNYAINDAVRDVLTLGYNGSASYFNGCNVGIGTTSPSYALDVNGGSGFRDTLRILASGTQAVVLTWTDTNNGVVDVKNGGNTTVKLLGNGASYFNGGNVGIGTTSPAQLLHLETTLGSSSGVGTAIQITSGGAGGDQAWIGVNKGTGNGLEISVENRDIIFNTGATTPFGGTERMRLTSSGNLGLGVTPSAWMSGSTALQVVRGGLWHDGSGYLAMFNNAYYDGSNWRYIASTTATVYNQVNGANQWSIAPTGTAGNIVSFTQAMTLNASGNLSVGNTNDTYKLDVSGTGRFRANGDNLLIIDSADNNAPILLFNKSNSNKWQIAVDRNTPVYGGASNDINFNNGTSTIFRLAYTTGAATFSNSFTTSDTSAIFLSPSLGTNQTVFLQLGKNIADTYNSGEMSFKFVASGSSSNMVSLGFYGAGQKLNVLGNGNVGIGTTSPDIFGRFYDKILGLNSSSGIAKIEINGSTYSGIDLGQSGTRYAEINASSTDFSLATTTANPMIFYTNSTERMRITSGGNVEIATGSIKTGAPSGGTAQPWKLGTVYTGTCVPSDFGSFGSWFTGTVIEIEVNGTTYKIPAVIDNYC